MSKIKFIYFIELLWLLSILTLTTLVYLHHDIIGLFFNSDYLMFLNFFNDIFFNHGHYKDWIIAPAPHFFPDMFIFFPFFFLIKNIYFQFLIVSWLMIISSYLSIRLIYRHFFTKQATAFALTATCSLFLLALKKKSPYILALIPGVHVGEFIAGLFLLGIHLILIGHNKFDYKACLLCVVSGIIAFGAGISDLLFLVQFACPIFLAYGFLWKFKRIKFHLALIFSSFVIIFASLGASLTKYLVPKDILLDYLAHPSITKISVKSIIIQLHAVWKLTANINNREIEVVMCIFYLLIFSILILSYTDFNKKIKVDINSKIMFLSVFIISSISLNIVSYLIFVNPANVIDRYFVTFYYFPFLLFFVPLSCFKQDSYIYKIMTKLSFLMLFYILANMYLLFHKPGFKIHMGYYPPEIRCIDEALHGHGHNGIAQYWDANYITSLSKENTQIVPVNPDLTPFYWSINVKKFGNPLSFILLDTDTWTLNKDIIYAKYGAPEKEVICNTKKVLLYPKDKIKLQ